MMSPKNLIVIVGPTAVGKTTLSIQLATLFNAEIISADSRQFFREMNIGTAKPTANELSTIKHHFINNISVTDDYDAGKYEQEADVLINDLFKTHHTLFLVGGSGMYVNAICNGFDDLPPIEEGVRKKIGEIYKKEGLPTLQAQLKNLDPDYYQKVDLKNPQRLMRALEMCISTGQPYSSFRKGKYKTRNYTLIKIGLNTNREHLYKQIDERVDKMMEAGLPAEVKKLLSYKTLNALQTVGYKELFDYLDGKHSLEKAVELVKQNSRNFAKRQLTWFKKDITIKWFEPTEMEAIISYLRERLVPM